MNWAMREKSAPLSSLHLMLYMSPLLFFRWFTLPREMKLPLIMMARREHRRSHSSILFEAKITVLQTSINITHPNHNLQMQIITNIANRQLENVQWTQVNRKNTDLFLERISTFDIQRKKIDALKALWHSTKIYDWHFFDTKIKPIWENWINK